GGTDRHQPLGRLYPGSFAATAQTVHCSVHLASRRLHGGAGRLRDPAACDRGRGPATDSAISDAADTRDPIRRLVPGSPTRPSVPAKGNQGTLLGPVDRGGRRASRSGTRHLRCRFWNDRQRFGLKSEAPPTAHAVSEVNSRRLTTNRWPPATNPQRAPRSAA